MRGSFQMFMIDRADNDEWISVIDHAFHVFPFVHLIFFESTGLPLVFHHVP